ncbi:Beta-ketoacyl synthase [Metarhizium album ARSEF 1941]|uniref:Beta-ketoacyl synthase n=1 Tax=Metarhizium album (strain ARSEF 1941) TaxID=1081103 RepID=A0A0B2WK07_METAS|nr:Beta-ketoacyl synthase [Metarhizium album ARSEF 1941]KHN93792.1 Beta-ketoacyl synthase [Metarhizium album ARSEF 1941]
MEAGFVREQPEPIAIVGIGCRFPGGASTPSKLWDVLKEAPNTAKVIPPQNASTSTDSTTRWAPITVQVTSRRPASWTKLDEDVRRFDAGFFNIPPPEAGAMDPQHRLLMETVYEAMEVSGTTIEQLHWSNTSAFVGVMCSDYYILSAQDLDSVSTYNSTGIANSSASARLSYFFDRHGRLVAVHQAVQALRAGTSLVAVAAGTNLLLCPLGYMSESLLGMLSPSGRCQMWDEKADGYARGEGVACVLLKKLSDAIADGDHVDCVIRETGVNQDGKTKGIAVPSAVSQASPIQRTYHQAGLDPRSKKDRCQYFEAHGTGTPAGDPQEAEALDTAFFQNSERDANDILYVGFVKTVVGHTGGTAGLAGIIKACLSIKHGIISPNLHLDNLSPSVKPFCKNLEVVTSIMPWPELPAGQVRRASVNSFGFGATNAHAILESPWYSGDLQAQVQDRTPGSVDKEALHLPFLFSATSENPLVALVDSYSKYLENKPDVDLCRLAYTLGCRRSAFAFKTSFSAASQEELCSKLSESASDQGNLSFVRSTTTNPSLLGVFTGQGAQWPKMGASLLQSSNRAMDIINELDASLAALPASERPSSTLRDELLADASTSRVGEATIAQPLVCAVQILLVTSLRDAGVQFKSVVGHSFGEIGAVFAAGFINHNDAIRIAYYRGLHSKLAQSASGETGGMLVAGLSYEEAIELCDHEDFTGRITAAASNSPTSVTFLLVLEDEETFVRALRVDKAYHSHHMKPASGPFLESVRNCAINIRTPPNDAPTWFPNVYGGQVMEASDIIKGSYWIENLLNPVLFSQALETALLSGDAFDAAVEIGPHPALKGPATEVMKAVTGKIIPYSGTLARGKHEVESFSDALGHIWTNAGPCSIHLDSYGQAMYQDWKTIKILRHLPAYPWNRDRILWTESRGTKLWRQQEGKFHDMLGTRCADGTEEEWRWKNLLHPKELPWVLDHALQGQTVFPGTGYLCLALEAAMQIAGNNSVQLLELTGDVEVFQGETGYKSIPVEGVAFIPFTAATASNDRGLFAHNVYGIESPNGQAALGGFFSKAQEDFAAYKDRMIYKTLDITVDPTEQGFEQGAYDLVVAANVLHATPDLVATLSNARKLLHPGGFLVMMEFTDESVLRLGVIIGGLPGRWIGADTGRKHSPCVSLPEWNDILLSSGFAGVETSTPVLDPVVMPASIIVGQAVNSDLLLPREPTAVSREPGMAKNAELLIVGGAGVASAKVVEDVVATVRPHYKLLSMLGAGTNPSADHGLKNPTVLSLQDLDGTFWRDMTVRRFERLKSVFLTAANMLWAILQVMDLEDASKADGSVIAQRLLRVDMSSYMNKTGSLGRTMFSNEPELRFRDGYVLIPRCLSHVDQNHRYDSLKRVIDKETCLDESIATLNWSRSAYTLREDECAVLPCLADHRRVRVDSSLASSIVTPAGRLFFSLGTDMDTGRRVVSASSKNSSAILVPQKWSVDVDVSRSIDSQYLSFLSGYLLSQHLSSRMPAGGDCRRPRARPGLGLDDVAAASHHGMQGLVHNGCD